MSSHESVSDPDAEPVPVSDEVFWGLLAAGTVCLVAGLFVHSTNGRILWAAAVGALVGFALGYAAWGPRSKEASW